MKPLFVSDMFLVFNADNIAEPRIALRYFNRVTFGLAGAMLMDLMIYKKIEIDRNRVRIIDTSSTDDPYLDDALFFLSQLKENKKLRFYLNEVMYAGFNLFPLLIERLAHLNFMNLRFGTRKVLWATMLVISVEYINREIQDAIVDKLKEVLLRDALVPNKAIWYLLSLLRATNGYGYILGKEHRSTVKSRIKQLIVDEPIGKAVKWRIRDAESSDTASID